jgi:choice-of-anchor C domain-containing protein
MKKALRHGLAIGLFLSACGVAEANLITNGSFESGSYSGGTNFETLYTGSTSITGWTVRSGSIDWINQYWDASEGARSIDLAGLNSGSISTNLNTIVGQSYRVQFEMAGNPDRDYAKTMVAISALPDPSNNTLQNYNRIVTAIDLGELAPLDTPTSSAQIYTFIQTGHTRDSMGWETKVFEFVAESALTQLLFGDLTSSLEPYYGAALDNVRAERVEPVPEPCTFLLLGAGIAGIGLLRGKQRRSSKG